MRAATAAVDNGWHLGEHLVPIFNKREPYETDVQLPMYVLGPAVSAGRTLTHPTQHTDLVMTFLDLAGALAHAPIAELDGTSFAPLLSHSPAGNFTPWRTHSFQEFHQNCNTCARRTNTAQPDRRWYGWWQGLRALLLFVGG